ncbi:MAG: WXG100 family type VII secretion target [Nakamurella sp.]
MSSRAPILVDYAQLTAAELAMAASQRRITAALAELDGDLVPLLATWEGDGKQAYLRQQDKWNAAADELNRTLAAVHTAVGEANRRYQDTDRRVAAAWGGM